MRPLLPTGFAGAALVLAVAVAAPAAAASTTTTAASSTVPISIPSIGVASPYPSVIQVSGTSGPIEDVTVELRSFSHTYLGDVYISVQSPEGTIVRLWGLYLGSTDANGTYTFSTDGASAPHGDVLPSGRYQPQGRLVDPGHATSLTAFDGQDADGEWKLYVDDRLAGDLGAISGGWALHLTTEPDATPPAIAIDSPADGSRHLLGSSVLADYTCTDDALATCDGPVADGAAVNTSSVGSHPFTVTATDATGNNSELTHTYAVVWNYTGFFSPVDNPGLSGSVYNVAKGGSVVPVKFSLDGYRGLNVLAGGVATSKRIGCDGTATQDPVEETATPGASQLTYDAATDRYHYNWKTDKAWVNTCRVLVVELADGTQHTALFTFKK